MRRIRLFAIGAALAAVPAAGSLAAPAAAQDTAPHSHGLATAEGLPAGWLMRLDRSAAEPGAVEFQVMEPGWHVTTDRAGSGIFWRPEQTAAGSFRASATMNLMSPAPHPESFGLFVGGTDLRSEDQSYVYFLVRQNGQYLIKRRNGEETEPIVEWTPHEAVPIAGEDGPTRYELAIDVGPGEVAFFVNGTRVHSLPADQLQMDGIVGVRINHRLDIHLESLEVDSP